MHWIETKIIDRQEVAERIIQIELQGQAPLPEFEPGAHVDVRIPHTDLVRQYSMLNDPAQSDTYVLAIQHELQSRGGSSALFQHAQVGDRLWISPPKNRFQLVAEAPHHILIAGGIGITPLLSMAQSLRRTQASFVLHYSTRNRARTAFYETLSTGPLAEQVRFYHDDYQGHIAFNLRMALEKIDLRSHVYVCGPATLIRAVQAGARVVGLPLEQVHSEYFSLEGLSTPPTAQENTPFEVVLAKSQQRVTVAADESIVQALEKIGVSVLVSCQEGICGTCVTPVLEGIPQHRDHYLHPEEKASHRLMTPCCSRAQSPTLVLDL